MKTDLICGPGLAPVPKDQYTIGSLDQIGVGMYILHESLLPMLNFLNLIIILCLHKVISLFLRNII